MDGTTYSISIENMVDSRRLPFLRPLRSLETYCARSKTSPEAEERTTGCLFLPKHNAKTPCKTTLKMKTLINS